MSDRVRTGRDLLASAHPAPTAAVTVVAGLLAFGVGLPAGAVALLAGSVLAGQLSIGWSNDRIDAARDAAGGRTGKPAAVGAVPLPLLTAAAAIAVPAGIALALPLGWRALVALEVLVAAGWAYNLGLKSTVLSGAAYLIGFAALPAAPYLALTGHPFPPWWAPVTGALLGFGAHCANVLPDLRTDAETGVRGLPHRLGARGCLVALAVSLTAASVVVVFGPGVPGPAASALGGLAVLLGLGSVGLGWRHPDSPAAFRSVLVVALLDVVLFVLATRAG